VNERKIRFSLVIMHWSQSVMLLYIVPGYYLDMWPSTGW